MYECIYSAGNASVSVSCHGAYFEGKCYVYHIETLTFADAVVFCQSQPGGNLTKIHSNNQIQFLGDLVEHGYV